MNEQEWKDPLDAPEKRRPGRPRGSLNKPKAVDESRKWTLEELLERLPQHFSIKQLNRMGQWHNGENSYSGGVSESLIQRLVARSFDATLDKSSPVGLRRIGSCYYKYPGPVPTQDQVMWAEVYSVTTEELDDIDAAYLLNTIPISYSSRAVWARSIEPGGSALVLVRRLYQSLEPSEWRRLVDAVNKTQF